MNRLILMGNGFDLAHGMPTKYNDFLLGYLTQAFYKAGSFNGYKDELLEIAPHNYNLSEAMYGPFKNINDLLDYCYNNGVIESLLLGRNIKAGSMILSNRFTVLIHSDFLKLLLKNFNTTNWVEIENEFYSQLKTILRMTDEPDMRKALSALNASMKGLINALHQYLSSLECTIENQQYQDILTEFISHKEIPLLGKNNYDKPERTLILNFNYTTTIDRYLHQLHPKIKETIQVNNIHGTLNDPDNPIVFGFGDELDEHYNLMEKSSVKGFFEHIKSFWYFRTENYHNLIRFIESDSYQVTILGHSCGLSDRTMLNMIFEHSNCKSIKIYYYENGTCNNYNELTEEISRHFSNKAALRAKVIPKPKCHPMPQASPQ